LEYKEKLEAEIKKIDNCEVVNPIGSDFQTIITHVVTPPCEHTVKSICAIFNCNWLVSVEWIENSIKELKFIDEERYGYKSEKSPIEGRAIYIEESFISNSLNKKRMEHLNVMLDVGKGKRVNSADDAEIIITNSKSKKKDTGGIKFFTFQKFIESFINILPPQFRKEKKE